IGPKLLQCGSNHGESFFFLLVEIVVATGQGRVLNASILQVVFDGAAYSHGAGYKQHLLSRFFFAANSGKELIQIVENFHVRLSLAFELPLVSKRSMGVIPKRS